MPDYLLKNAFFPFDASTKQLYIKDGIVEKIIETSFDSDYSEEAIRVVDLENRMVIPGFVDAHTHLDKTLIGKKVSNKSGTLTEAIQLMQRYKETMTKEEVKERAEQALTLSIDKGTRFIRTHVDIDDDIQLKSLEALLELKEKYKEKLTLQLVAFPQEGIDHEGNLVYLEKALQAGADLIGGIPARAEDPRRHIRKLFDLAAKYDVDVDMHIDETDDPHSLTVKELLKATKEYGYEGRVTAGHLCSLAAYETAELEPLVEEMKQAKMKIVSLPSTNLYLQGRNDKKAVRRGIAPIKYLHENGLPVMIASDNNQDPFNPFGNGSLLGEALIAAHGCHMGGEEDLETLFDMVTTIPGKELFDYSIKEGEPATFIVLDAYSKTQAIIDQASVYGKFIGSQLLIRSCSEREI